MKVLIARCDRLGDLVLALPAFDWLHQVRPTWEIHALVAPQTVPLIEHHPAIEAFHTWDGTDSAALVQRISGECYDAVVVLQYRAELVRMLKKAGIKKRYGPWSKPTSWLLLNRGTWQRRSRRMRHESDFNLELVRGLVGREKIEASARFPRLHLSETQRELGRRFRREESPEADMVVFVHPGSGGSALDFPASRFAEVANELTANRGWRVFLTGSHSDRPTIDSMAAYLDERVGVLVERYPLRDFLGILSAGDLIIAPSTGPLHAASALDLAAVGIYPPAPTMSPVRWGPLGRWVRTVCPPLDCPARRHCLMAGCLSYNCLELITPRTVIEAATALAAERSRDLATIGSES
jgi:heptosyltransferase III